MPRKIDHTIRQSIAKKLRQGVHPSLLARDYGVSRRTIYRSAQMARQGREERNSKTETVVCRVSPKDLVAFDAQLEKFGIRNRSEALRNIIRNTNGMAVPDAELRKALLDMKAALNRCGNNVVQIAKRLNEGKQRGFPPQLQDEDLVPIRHLGGLILDLADQVWSMAEGRRQNIEVEITDELKRQLDPAGHCREKKTEEDPSEAPFDENIGPLFRER